MSSCSLGLANQILRDTEVPVSISCFHMSISTLGEVWVSLLNYQGFVHYLPSSFTYSRD